MQHLFTMISLSLLFLVFSFIVVGCLMHVTIMLVDRYLGEGWSEEEEDE